ncbi:glycosyltransferase [Cellulomonas sp.]|uniref:glycosyltransferase family 2 protein n=1 Tax=Cellulomonas sp. TaxID=40001 RepID=UPI001B00BF15|nr:glycosyltransferase [Cellulomonas sp.]MBO9555496.1 glycosyltransferase [Cellulomonas sp.]
MALDIFVPFWGDPELLKETVRSVQAQTVDDWQLTVVDDAYPDPTVAEYFAALDDPRVTYVRNEQNLGITDNYRRCVSMATEELVVLLGCDDVMLPDYVATVLDAHRRFPQAHIIQPGVEVIGADGEVVSTLVDTVKQKVTMPRASQPRLLAGEELAASLLRADWLYWPSLVFRRESMVAAGFRDDYPLIQDLALEIDIIAAGGPLLLVPHVCFRYRRHDASASSATSGGGKRFDGERRYFAEAAEQMAALGWRRAARAARWHLTSRAHALTLLPRVLVARDSGTVRMLAHHAFAPTRRSA